MLSGSEESWMAMWLMVALFHCFMVGLTHDSLLPDNQPFKIQHLKSTIPFQGMFIDAAFYSCPVLSNLPVHSQA
jgi:hypothetical protein